MNRLLSNCPVCSGTMHVSEQTCDHCDTAVRSRFESSRFSRLNLEQSQFLDLFLRLRGNISAVGAELGISHPTATKRLDAVLSALGLAEAEGFEAGFATSAPYPGNEVKELERSRVIE